MDMTHDILHLEKHLGAGRKLTPLSHRVFASWNETDGCVAFVYVHVQGGQDYLLR